MAGTLYLVPTPIGNLGDVSRRMAETLEQLMADAGNLDGVVKFEILAG